jgi:C_GCAxxG_C_C family probable redox protein
MLWTFYKTIIMNPKAEKAINSFRSGLNCSQSVLNAYADEMKVDNEFALSVSCGFGGGMGRLQETCGAVTGAFMVFGVYNWKKFNDNKDRKEKTYAMIQRFSKKFKSVHTVMDCKTLIGVDLNTDEGQKYVAENNLHEKVCERCIADAIAIVDEMIQDKSL